MARTAKSMVMDPRYRALMDIPPRGKGSYRRFRNDKLSMREVQEALDDLEDDLSDEGYESSFTARNRTRYE